MNYRDNATPSAIVSGSFGTEVITLSSSVGQGSDQPCREVIILVQEGKDMKLGESAAAAASGVPLPDGVTTSPIVLAISNTNKLYFNGSTGEEVYLIWRS